MLHMRILLFLSVFALLLFHAACGTKAPVKEEISKTETVRWADRLYDVVQVHPRKQRILMDWKNEETENPTAFRDIASYESHLIEKGYTPLMITNAGIFMEDSTPLGLYVEEGKVLRETNRVKEAYGNFYMQPNGVFYLSDKSAEVIPTEAYDPAKHQFDYATQSGPMLVIDGEINSNFRENSENEKLRSGVGVDLSGNVFFVISQGPVNFYEFATLFREKFSCPNALYLDGVISRMYCPSLEREQKGGNFGALIAVVEE